MASKLKVPDNKDKPPLLAIKGGKPIFSKPLKPGVGVMKNGENGRKKEAASKKCRTIENYVK